MNYRLYADDTQLYPCNFGSSVGHPERSHLFLDDCQSLGSSKTEFRLIRPFDVVVGGLRFYRDSVFSFSSFFFFTRQLPSELAERNSTKTDHMLGSECDFKMHVQNLGYTLLLQIGGQNQLFLDDFAT